MFKRTVPLLAALLLLVAFAPAAVAADDPGQGRPTGRTAKPDRRGRARAEREKLRKLAEQARKACSKARDTSDKPGKAHRQQCGKAVQRLLGALKQAERRLEQLQGRLEQAIAEKCGDASGERADRCARARQRLEKLQAVRAKLHALIEKLESRIENTGDAGQPPSAQSVAVSDDEIETVEELEDELVEAGK